jgi:outer membrane protein assembly factor BamA
MKCKVLPALTAGALLCAWLPGAAQTYLARTIQFKGADEYTAQELLQVAELAPGAALTQVEMQDHGQKLMDTGLFETLNFKFDGGNLVYTLTPLTSLLPVRLENLPLAKGEELDAALRAQVPLYHGKVPTDGGLTQAVGRALEEILKARGIQATVIAAPFVDQRAHDVTAVSFTITAPPVRVGEIHVEGVSAEMQVKVNHVADGVTRTAYDTEHAAENVEHAFAMLYADEGYATARVRAEQKGTIAGGEAIDVPFSVTVEEGRHYKLGSIRLPSGDLLNLAEINKAAGAGSNAAEKQAVKGGVTLRTALLYVAGQYKSTGHMDCVVTPHLELDDAAGVANYRLEVDPGPVYTMGKLTIENGADDLHAAMLAAWKLPEGAVFDGNAIASYFYRQGNTPLGRTFASANCRWKLTAHQDTRTVDVTLRLEQRPSF